MRKDKEILLAAQRDAKTNDPNEEDIYKIGTIGTIIQMLRLPDGTVKVLVEGKRRAQILRYVPNPSFFMVEAERISEADDTGVETEALMRTLVTAFENYVKLNKKIPSEVLVTISSIDKPSRLGDTIASHLGLKLQDKQEILECTSPAERLEKLYEKLQGEVEILQIEKRIRTRVKKQMEKSQKEYYLTEQMRAIQKELGEKDDFKSEIQEFEEKLKQKSLSEDVEQKVKRELKKLKMMSPMSAEATVVRNYIDWLLSIPWTNEKTEDRLDLDEATKKLEGPILCFVGPPGVGKTSLAKSIARAMGRKFVRVSLGGVRDEAEIRG